MLRDTSGAGSCVCKLNLRCRLSCGWEPRISDTLWKPHSHPQTVQGLGPEPLLDPPHMGGGQCRSSRTKGTPALPTGTFLQAPDSEIFAQVCVHWVCNICLAVLTPSCGPTNCWMQHCIFGSWTSDSKNPDSRFLGMGQCRPLCFELSLPTVFQLWGRLRTGRNARFLSQESFEVFFFFVWKMEVNPDTLGGWPLVRSRVFTKKQMYPNVFAQGCWIPAGEDCCCSAKGNAETVLWARAQPPLRSISANSEGKGKGKCSGATASHTGTLVFRRRQCQSLGGHLVPAAASPRRG